MKELDHLKSMWAPKTKRKTKLIVPGISYSNELGSLKNESWFFDVKYAFRDALDIKYEKRMKDKKPCMVWTQGPILAFGGGDTIHSRDGKRAVQVLFATQMGWDPDKAEMYQGSVAYQEFSVAGHVSVKAGEHTCTQMQFLRLLISGSACTEPEQIAAF